MKIFVSSLITGMEAERAAVRRAIELLDHEPIMAEDFKARPDSPQVACLSELRGSDAVVFVFGPRYGWKQASGVSATHEEFRTARGRKPLLVFLGPGDPEPDQAALIEEASGWEGGVYRASYSTPEDLQAKVIGAIHKLSLANATAPLDPSRLAARASAILPEQRRDGHGSVFFLGVAAGPEQTVLRPSEMDDAVLAEGMQQQALFGPTAIFARAQGTLARMEGDALVIYQGDRYAEAAAVRLWPTGDIAIQLPLARGEGGMGFAVIVEEEIEEKLRMALAYATWLLDKIDPTKALTHIALSARVVGGSAYEWRTRAQHAASPNSGTIAMFSREDERDAPVSLSPAHKPRAALSMDAARISQDLLALMRRRWKADQ